VHSLLKTMYDNQPDGMAGNEDCGQMSAWFVISSLGLYAVDPVSAKYDVSTPLFDHVEIELAGERRLVIETKRESPDAVYIQSVVWNGEKVNGMTVDHADLIRGGTLEFHLVNTPSSTV
jgi:putative alpha-1,2-mannosidase